MSAPAHYIRTIQTSFTTSLASPSAHAAGSSSSHSNVLANIGGVMNRYPPGLGLGEWRTGLASAPKSSSSGSTPNSRKRPAYRMPYSSRRAPPPPPRSSSQSLPVDATLSYHPNPKSMVSNHSHGSTRVRPRTASLSSHYTVQIPEAMLTDLDDPEAKSKLVAGILLNRVHAVGKPMRRRPSAGSEPRTYVRSGLSSVVSVDESI